MRVREIGIRMALGAQRGQIAAMVLRHGVNLALAGCALGLIVTFSAGQALRSMLYGVSLYDPVTALGACVVLMYRKFKNSFRVNVRCCRKLTGHNR
jgi:ABC-type antimicrobial peptide transport system permease subunit